MVMKEDVRELFHTFPGEVEDPALDCLIRDIHEDKFVKGFWDVKRNQNKKNVKARAAVESAHPSKKQKVKKDMRMVVSCTEDGESDDEGVQKEKMNENPEAVIHEEDVGKDVSVRTLVSMVSRLYGRFDNIDGRLASVDSSFKEMAMNLEKVIGDSVEMRMVERYDPRLAGVEVRVGCIEDEMKQMKERLKVLGVGETGQNDLHSQQGVGQYHTQQT